MAESIDFRAACPSCGAEITWHAWTTPIPNPRSRQEPGDCRCGRSET